MSEKYRYITSKNGQKLNVGKFLIFCELLDRTGKNLARTILDASTSEDIDVKNMRGQGYDGCIAMSGIYNGVQAQIKAEVPEALLFTAHCIQAHLLLIDLSHYVPHVGWRDIRLSSHSRNAPSLSLARSSKTPSQEATTAIEPTNHCLTRRISVALKGR